MSPPARPSVVFDAVTYLQAVMNAAGPAAECLRFAERGHLSLFVSHETLAELHDVLARPVLRRKNPHLTDAVVDAFLDRLRTVATGIDPVPPQFRYERDPKDEAPINLALAAAAEYLVTWDRDLLDLMDENRSEGADFRSRFPGLTIVTPVELLRRIRTQGAT